MSKFQKAWIWIWYNDATRLLFIFFGGNLLLTIPLLFLWSGLDAETIRGVAAAQYAMFFGWGILDNDYSNLRKIGMDEFRNHLK